MTIREDVLSAVSDWCRCDWPGSSAGTPPPQRCECDDRADAACAVFRKALKEACPYGYWDLQSLDRLLASLETKGRQP